MRLYLEFDKLVRALVAKRSRLTRAERVIRQVSEMRELGRRLFIAGYKAGLHGARWTAVPPLPRETRR